MEAVLLDGLGTRIKAGIKKTVVVDLLVKKAQQNWMITDVPAVTVALGMPGPVELGFAHAVGKGAQPT